MVWWSRHGPGRIAAAIFGMISYLAGNAVFSDYLQINDVAVTGDLRGAVRRGGSVAGTWVLVVQCAAASIFMATPARSRSAACSVTIAVAVKHEIVLGGESADCSVAEGSRERAGGILQAHGNNASSRWRRHHHFEHLRLDRAANRDPVLESSR